jgi:hypothetical protein
MPALTLKMRGFLVARDGDDFEEVDKDFPVTPFCFRVKGYAS